MGGQKKLLRELQVRLGQLGFTKLRVSQEFSGEGRLFWCVDPRGPRSLQLLDTMQSTSNPVQQSQARVRVASHGAAV